MVTTVGEINYPEFHQYLTETVFIIQEEMETMKKAKALHDKLYQYMKEGFERYEVRNHPVNFKFSNAKSEVVKQMPINNFITHIILWSPFSYMDKIYAVNSSFILPREHITNKYINEYINEKIIIPNREEVDNKDLCNICDDLIDRLAQISMDFNRIMGMSINTESFIELAKRNEQFKDFIHTKPAPGAQPREIETMLHEREIPFVDLLKHEKNVLQPMLLSGVGIKIKQLVEFAMMGGLKPDLDGNTIPIPIDSNFLVGGLNSISNYYIDSQSGKKSIILNKTSMGLSGHFSTKVMMLASRYRLSQTVDCCDSIRPIKFFVKNKDFLKRINNRYYYMDENMSEMKCIDFKRDKDLIGKVIYLRDPSTCTAPDGICHKCYGDLYYTNKNKKFNAGAYAATQLTNPVQQKILSTKHLLTTNSVNLKFSEGFDRFFILDANKIRINPDFEGKLSEWSIVIEKDDLYEIIEQEEADFNLYTDKFYIKNKRTKESYEITEINTNQNFYINLDISSMFDTRNEDYVEVSLDKIEEDVYVAMIVIENNELTKPLKNLMRLLDRKDHYGCETVDDLVNKICELVIESDIKIQLNHCSLILKGIVKDVEDVLQHPHFNEFLRKDSYQIMTVSSALMSNPSLTTSLAFQYLAKQVTLPLTNRKYGTSSYDDLFSLELKKGKKVKNRIY